jgi:putative membrane protein
MRTFFSALSISILAGLPVHAALAQYGMGWQDGGGWGPGFGWGHMLFGSVMMILFWGLILFVLVVAIRWAIGRPHDHHAGGAAPGSGRKRAIEILEERFARGEIDREEFEERRRLLSDS